MAIRAQKVLILLHTEANEHFFNVFGKKSAVYNVGKKQKEIRKSLFCEELLYFRLHSGTIITLIEKYLPLNHNSNKIY